MADILIWGMEMPKNCGSCRFMYQEVGEMNDDIVMVLMCSACFQGTAELEYKNERAAFCPLVELPEHGDLIDRDKLEYHRAYFWHPDPELPDGGRFGGANAVVPSLGIKEAPVIVPASKEDLNTMDEFMRGQECGNPEDGSL